MMRNEVPSKGLEWTNLLLGLGLACAAFALTTIPAAAWNAGVVGVLIACCSAVALASYAPWAEWSNITLGCWTIVAPFLLGFGTEQAAMWTHVLIGIAVASVATIQLVAANKSRGVTHDRPIHNR